MAPKRKIETISEPDLNSQDLHPSKVRRTNSRGDHERQPPALQPPGSDPETQARAQDSQVPSDRESTSAPLTKENLRLLATMTGSKGPTSTEPSSEPCEDAPPTAKSSKSSKSSRSAKTVDSKKSLSTTETGFEDKLRKNGVPPEWRTNRGRLPDQDEIEERLNASRASASPTVSFYEMYVENADDAGNEVVTVDALNRAVLKDTRWDPKMMKMHYRGQWDRQWTDYPKDVGFNNGLSAPKPDYVEGYAKTAFPPSIEKIGGAATLVKAQSNFVALPHFAVEAKLAGKDMHLAQVQAQYDAAAMVYGRDKALQYLEQTDPPEKPAVSTIIADGEVWRAFLHYAHKDEETNKTTYRTHCIAEGNFQGFDAYKDGYKKIRNLQDMMRENATDLKNRLQKDFDEHGLRTPAVDTSSIAPSAEHCPTTQNSSSGGSVQSGPAKSQATAPSVTPPSDTPSSASSGASKSGSKAAQPKDSALPPTPSSNASVSSSRSATESGSLIAQHKGGNPPQKSPSIASGASSVSGSVCSDRRSDRYRNRDEHPPSLQKRRSDSPDRSRPPRKQDQHPASKNEAAPRDAPRPQKAGKYDWPPVKDRKSSNSDGSTPLKNTTKPPNTDDRAPLKKSSTAFLKDDRTPIKKSTKPLDSDDLRPNKKGSTPVQNDRRPGRNSASVSSSSSSNNIFKKPASLQHYDQDDQVQIPMNSNLLDRKWR